MIRYVVKRLLWMIPVMLGIAILIFSIMYICPGDPAQSILGPSATPVELAAKREEMGLNDPYIVRLGRYLYDTFIRFDLGTSYKYGVSVLSGLMERMQYTLIIAAELSGRFYYDRKPLNAEALHVNSSYLTAVANDYSFDAIYSRMVDASAKKGDVLIAISTSGNSSNIIKAIESAKEKDMTIIGMTGESGGKMPDMCDVLLNVPSTCTPRIQESHIMVGHIICEIIESTIFPR